MKLELEPYVNFTESETKVFEDARGALWLADKRGPRIENKWTNYMVAWRRCQRHSLVGMRKALACELELAEWSWDDRKKTWKKHPEYAEHLFMGFRNTQPEHYREVVMRLRKAMRLTDRAIALIDANV